MKTVFTTLAVIAAAAAFAAPDFERRADVAMEKCFERCFSEKTSLLYGCPPAGVKKAAEFKDGVFDWYKGIEGGYGKGMGDCGLNHGVAMVGVMARWDTLVARGLKPDDPELVKTADWAHKLAQGLVNLAGRHRFTGFVARGLCEEDGKSICSLSSVDQHTHWAHGLWLYCRAPFAKPEIVAEAKQRLAEVAARMERTVVKESGWNFGLCDGRPDPRNICTVWGPKCFGPGAARLACIYAAAAEVTGDAHWAEKYEEYADEACRRSALFSVLRRLDPKTKWNWPAYVMMQMNCSLDVLLGYEKDEFRLKFIRESMAQAAAECDTRQKQAIANPKINWYGMYAPGELAISQLISPDSPYDEAERQSLGKALLSGNNEKWGTFQVTHAFTAYWLAARRGITPLAD